MYAINTGKEAIPGRKVTRHGIGQGMDVVDAHGDETDERLLLGLPLYRRNRKLLRWLVPLAAVSLLAGAVVAIWIALSTSFDANRVAVVRPAAANAAEEQLAANVPPPVVPADKVEQKPEAAKKESARPAETQTTKVVPPVEPAKTPDAKVAKKPAVAVAAEAPAKDRREIGKVLMTAPAVLVQRAAGDGPWQRVKPESGVHATDSFISLPGYRSEIRFDSGVGLTLWGNLPELSSVPVLESAVVPYANKDVDADFTLSRGRVVVANHKSQGAARVRVRFQDEIWTITLPEPGNEVSLELGGLCVPYASQAGRGEPEISLGMIVLKGEAILKIRYENFMLQPRALVDWDSNTGFARGPILEKLPEWLTGTAVAPAAIAKSVASALDNLTKRLVAQERIDIVLAEALQDADAAGRVLAVRCLGAMDELSSLTDALSDPKHAEVRITAIEELQHFLGQSSRNDARLATLFRQKNFSDERGLTLLHLLHGYSQQQWANPNVRAAVVDYLNVENLAIRQVTATLLLSLNPEGRGIRYDPAGESRQREQGYEQWRDLLLRKPTAKKENGQKRP
jgi:hypothetical protein